MEHLLLIAVAFLASGLTFFSGFGLGTLLLPPFALFLPVEEAIAATAVVHLLNNLFKAGLVARFADRGVVLRFGLPAILAALAGAELLLWLTGLPPIWSWRLAGKECHIQPVNLAVGALMVLFSLLEVLPRFSRLAFPRRWLPLGGLLSGFFGGLSGHQGALRAAFLVRCSLSKEAFLGSGVVIACLVDLTRLGRYAPHLAAGSLARHWDLLLAATLAAFAGALLGNRLLRKMTLHGIQVLVSALLVLLGLALGSGLI